MKNFLTHICFFIVIPIVIILLLIEVPLRSIPNDYTYKDDWMRTNGNRVKTLVFGSSHAYYGILPTEFDKLSFSLANMSQDLTYDEFLYNKYVDYCDSLEYIILPISYFTLRSLMENGEEWFRVKNYCIYLDCPYHKLEPEYNLEIYSNLNKKTFSRLLGAYRGNESRVNCDIYGSAATDVYMSADKLSESGFKAAKRHTIKHCKNVSSNINTLNRILTDAHNRGVKVLIVTTPTHYSYYSHLDSIQYNEFIECCHEMSVRYSNVSYYNWIKNDNFVDTDFQDGDHLNATGAKKLSKMLNQIITTETINVQNE